MLSARVLIATTIQSVDISLKKKNCSIGMKGLSNCKIVKEHHGMVVGHTRELVVDDRHGVHTKAGAPTKHVGERKLRRRGGDGEGRPASQ